MTQGRLEDGLAGFDPDAVTTGNELYLVGHGIRSSGIEKGAIVAPFFPSVRLRYQPAGRLRLLRSHLRTGSHCSRSFATSEGASSKIPAPRSAARM